MASMEEEAQKILQMSKISEDNEIPTTNLEGGADINEDSTIKNNEENDGSKDEKNEKEGAEVGTEDESNKEKEDGNEGGDGEEKKESQEDLDSRSIFVKNVRSFFKKARKKRDAHFRKKYEKNKGRLFYGCR